ncbi:MAG: LytR/AlgR family response regulator transcription factor [bacterium]
MLIFAIDDEKIALDGLISAIRKAAPAAEVIGFRSAEKAIAACHEMEPEVVFTDIEMRDTNGVELARQMKALLPDINIIFTTGYTEYTVKAFEIHASGYILKPVTAEKVYREIQELRHPVMERWPKRGLYVRAFGNFEVLYDGKPVKFQYSKTKEFFAYLIDRKGALATMAEMEAVLWEEEEVPKSHNSYLKNLRADLVQVLERLNCSDILVRSRGNIGILPEKVSCDYFEFLLQRKEGKSSGLYYGEYMTQYSWAETTHGSLERM